MSYHILQLYWKGLLCKDMDKLEHTNSKNLSCGEPDQNSDNEDGVVPIELTPGHVRSELPGKGLVISHSLYTDRHFLFRSLRCLVCCAVAFSAF